MTGDLRASGAHTRAVPTTALCARVAGRRLDAWGGAAAKVAVLLVSLLVQAGHSPVLASSRAGLLGVLRVATTANPPITHSRR